MLNPFDNEILNSSFENRDRTTFITTFDENISFRIFILAKRQVKFRTNIETRSAADKYFTRSSKFAYASSGSFREYSQFKIFISTPFVINLHAVRQRTNFTSSNHIINTNSLIYLFTSSENHESIKFRSGKK